MNATEELYKDMAVLMNRLRAAEAKAALGAKLADEVLRCEDLERRDIPESVLRLAREFQGKAEGK